MDCVMFWSAQHDAVDTFGYFGAVPLVPPFDGDQNVRAGQNDAILLFSNFGKFYFQETLAIFARVYYNCFV